MIILTELWQSLVLLDPMKFDAYNWTSEIKVIKKDNNS